MPSSALKDLSAYQAPHWLYDSSGYYLHKGTVYLVLEVSTPGSGYGSLTQTVLTGMPAEARPATDTAITFLTEPTNTTDPANPSLNLPSTFAATVHASDGSITLDNPLPAGVLTIPPSATWFAYQSGTSHPQYTFPLALGIQAAASWPTVGGAGTDTFTPASLAPYLSTDFTDIDSGYAIHGTRVHLTGHVTAAHDSAELISQPLPAHVDDGLKLETFSFHDAPIGGFAAYVRDSRGGSSVFIGTDTMQPSGSDAALSGVSPPSSTIGNYNTDVPAPGASPLTPTDAPANVGPIYDWGTFWQHDTFAGATYSCASVPPGASFTCFQAVNGLGVVTVNLASLLPLLTPQPDWFLLLVRITGFANIGSDGTCLAIAPGGCGPNVPMDTTLTVTGAALQNAAGTAITDHQTSSGPALSFDIGDPGTAGAAYLAPATPLFNLAGGTLPTSSVGYLYQPTQLWKASQATGTVTLGYTVTQAAQGEQAVSVQVLPFYKTRQIGLHAGDILTLDGSGWEGLAARRVMSIT